MVEELSSLSARLSLRSSPGVFTLDFFSLSSFFFWAFAFPRSFPLDSKPADKKNKDLRHLLLPTDLLFSFFFDKTCYLWSVLSGSSAPGGSHLLGGLADRDHCPWLLSGWRILHLQHQRHYWAMKNRLHFGSEHPAVWYFEPSDWSADRLGHRLGLSLYFLWSGARKQLA